MLFRRASASDEGRIWSQHLAGEIQMLPRGGEVRGRAERFRFAEDFVASTEKLGLGKGSYKTPVGGIEREIRKG